MKRRGLTIFELLTSLALLGALCSLLTSWLVTVSRLSADRGPRLEWRSAALRILDAIEDDLTCGDFDSGDRKSKVPPRVDILELSRLRIATRNSATLVSDSPGPAIHEYRWDRLSHTLLLSISSRARLASTAERPLATSVADWKVEMDDEQRVLTVTIESRYGDELRRRFTWP